MSEPLARRLAANLRHLREARGLTQSQMARLAGLPRATWGHLETGAANPTLLVLDKAATALQVPIEELTAAPRSVGRLYTSPARAASSRSRWAASSGRSGRGTCSSSAATSATPTGTAGRAPRSAIRWCCSPAEA